MTSFQLRVYLLENQKHRGELLYEWLIEQAKAMGIPGASVMRTITGYGRHKKLHEEGFFELAGDLPVVIDFFVSPEQAEQIMTLLASESLHLFYVKTPAESGFSGA